MLTRGEKISIATTKHGESRDPTPEHNAWRDLISRCKNKRHRAYKRYGARGIDVDSRWLGDKGYENFLKDMGRRPSPEHSIERKNNNLGYSKKNCVWATKKDQQNNRENSRLLTYGGRTMTVARWADELSIPKITLYSRIRRGWDVKRALEKR